jgi:predicted metal-dependent hydrolase
MNKPQPYKSLTAEQIIDQCSVRVSSRAKYMHLSVSLKKGVEVVVPRSISQRRANHLIPQLIIKQQHWINTTLQKLSTQQRLKPLLVDCQLPEIIDLKAVGNEFKVEYKELVINKVLLKTIGFETIAISGALSDRYHIFKLLEHYFKNYAYSILYKRLCQMSEQTGLTFNHLTVRSQKTRWGSCSARKNINLNYRLLFIDSRLVDYILLHELAHTVHLNHSRDFWLLVEQFMPEYKLMDKQINQIMKELPCWIFYKELK